MIEQYLKQNVGIELTDKNKEQFETYYGFLVSENEKYNLTAITQRDEVFEKHFADSLLGANLIGQNAKICDVGTGAGFPAIPLKVVRDDIDITLVDSLEKRINFCKTLCDKLEIGANFFHSRAEDFAKTNSEKFDACVARAVAPLNVLLEYTASVVKIGGVVIAYKTDESELANSKHACSELGLKFDKSQSYVLPSGANRCLLVFKKIAHTPNKYPRGQNKPRKMPL